MITHSTIPVLYSFRRCPYAIRARLALYYCGLTVELREVILREKPECMLRYSPKGTVPVLVLADNCVIDESIDIVNWALSKDDQSGLLMSLLESEIEQANNLIEENDFLFKPLLDRYKYADRYPEKQQQNYRCEAEYFLVKLEARLEKTDFLMGDKLSIADIAIFSFIRNLPLLIRTGSINQSIPAYNAG